MLWDNVVRSIGVLIAYMSPKSIEGIRRNMEIEANGIGLEVTTITVDFFKRRLLQTNKDCRVN